MKKKWCVKATNFIFLKICSGIISEESFGKKNLYEYLNTTHKYFTKLLVDWPLIVRFAFKEEILKLKMQNPNLVWFDWNPNKIYHNLQIFKVKPIIWFGKKTMIFSSFKWNSKK